MILSACSKTDNNKDTHISVNISPTITVEELKNIIESGKDIFLLDVRTEPEFMHSHLSFVDIRIPYDSLDLNLALLPDDKTTIIYCICRSGRRSQIAADYLKSNGYSNVINITGGILAWKDAGFETVSGI